MRILINCSNLKKGGGVQVADSVCCQLLRYPQHHFIVVLSSYMDNTNERLDGVENVEVVRHDIKNSIKTLLLGSAKFIATDSFHGTVAALICKKPFVVLYREYGLGSRIVDLLKQVGLEDRIFFNYEDYAKSDSWKKPIDYNEVDRRLEAYRQKSWDYLRGVVNGISK